MSISEKIKVEEIIEEIENSDVTDYSELPEEHPEHLSKDNQFIAEKLLEFYGLVHLNENAEMKKHLETQTEFTKEELYGKAKNMSKEEFLKYLDRIIFWKTFLTLKHNVDNIFIDEYVENAEDEKIINLLARYNVITSYNEKVKQWQGISNFNGGVIINLDNNRATCAMRTMISSITGNFYNETGLANNLTTHWMKENGINIDPRDRTYEELDKIAHECGTSIEEIEKDYQRIVEEIENNAKAE